MYSKCAQAPMFVQLKLSRYRNMKVFCYEHLLYCLVWLQII